MESETYDVDGFAGRALLTHPIAGLIESEMINICQPELAPHSVVSTKNTMGSSTDELSGIRAFHIGFGDVKTIASKRLSHIEKSVSHKF